MYAVYADRPAKLPSGSRITSDLGIRMCQRSGNFKYTVSEFGHQCRTKLLLQDLGVRTHKNRKQVLVVPASPLVWTKRHRYVVHHKRLQGSTCEEKN